MQGKSFIEENLIYYMEKFSSYYYYTERNLKAIFVNLSGARKVNIDLEITMVWTGVLFLMFKLGVSLTCRNLG